MPTFKIIIAVIIFSFLSYTVLPTIAKKLRLKDSERLKSTLPITANAKAGLVILAVIIIFFVIVGITQSTGI